VKSRPAPEGIEPKIIEATLLFLSHHDTLLLAKDIFLFNTFLGKVNITGGLMLAFSQMVDQASEWEDTVRLSNG